MRPDEGRDSSAARTDNGRGSLAGQTIGGTGVVAGRAMGCGQRPGQHRSQAGPRGLGVQGVEHAARVRHCRFA